MFYKCHNVTTPIFDANESLSSVDPRFPSVPSRVTFSLTLFYVVAYCGVFLSIYSQLWLILYYNYKRFSFQTTFLYLCLFWSGFRAILFSFYFNNTMTAATLPIFFYWLLYCFPVCLQFSILCLLNLYFGQVLLKVKSQYAANPRRYIIPLRSTCCVAVLVFVGMNLASAIIVHQEASKGDSLTSFVRAIVFARVVVNDMLFVISAILLAFCLFKISRTTSANIILIAQETTACRATSVGAVIILLFVSRSIYNLIAISPVHCDKTTVNDFEWYNVSDQAEIADLNQNMSYVLFGFVLFIWEFLPTSLTLFFFKVRKPETTGQNSTNLRSSVDGYQARVYFFDNPKQFTEEDHFPSSSLRARVGSLMYNHDDCNLSYFA